MKLLCIRILNPRDIFSEISRIIKQNIWCLKKLVEMLWKTVTSKSELFKNFCLLNLTWWSVQADLVRLILNKKLAETIVKLF